MRVQRVRKRDGREVAYDRRKIEGAVSRAEGAAGELRPGFSAEIAELVERLLERRFPDPELAVPGIEDIQDLVERALVEMGAAAVAKAYILYRDKRAQIRAALLVRDDPSGDRGDARDRRRLPRVENKDGVQAWSKGRIVAALMSEADLPRSSAEEVASRVEARVFAGGSTSISTALVRELVDNELVELGLEGALRRQRPIGVPRHDLRRTLLDAASIRAAGGTVEEAVSGEVLSRYAMEDLLPAYVADRVRAGDLDFEDLARPHLPLALAVPTDVLRGDALLGGEEDGARLLPEIAALSRCVSRGLAIEGAEPLIAGLARSSRSGAALPGWLAGLAGVAQASGRSIEIVLDEPRPAALEALLDALGTLARGRGPEGLPTVVLSQADWSGASAAARESAGRWIGAGLLVPSFGTAEARYAGPGLARAHGERATRSLAAVALVGLPRLARRAGAWREDAVFEGLVELLEAALDGLEALRDFQRETRDPAQPRARATFGIAPVGLREALAILGDGEPREEQAGRLVAFLREASERLSRSRAPACT